jgi:hypothetical protein
MSQDAVIALALVAIIWVGWPLHRIASHMQRLLDMAEKGQRK